MEDELVDTFITQLEVIGEVCVYIEMRNKGERLERN